MFEHYTEKARRVIFFARFEASQYGSPAIECEHLLLGLVREERSLRRWVPKFGAETIQQSVKDHLPKQNPISLSVDFPLSPAAQSVLTHAAEEAERLGDKNIDSEHVLLALLGDRDSFTSKLLLEAGANAGRIRQYHAKRPISPKPWASYPDSGSRLSSGETVEIHGSRWHVDYLCDAINLVRAYNWHWQKAIWKPRDIVIHCKDGTCSFDLTLAEDSANFVLVPEGWKKDHCFVCRWELFESDDEHGLGYTNGHDWLCAECYERFWQDPGFFSSSYSDIT